MSTEETVVEETTNTEAAAAEAQQGAGGEPTDQPTDAASPEESDAALLAGFNAARGIEQPEPEHKEEKAPEPVLIAGFTEEQIKEMHTEVQELRKLKGTDSKVFGRLGYLEGELKKVAQQVTGTTSVTLTRDQLKRVTAEYGPELAEALAQDLTEALKGAAVQPPAAAAPAPTTTAAPAAPAAPAPVASAQDFDARVNRTVEERLLLREHPDVATVASSEAFAKWVGSLPLQRQKELDAAEDASVVSKFLTEFKTQNAQAAAKTAANKQRLAAAVDPTKGTGRAAATVSDNDAFEAGFKSVRGG